MMLKTHLAFSFLLSLLIIKKYEFGNPFLFTAVAAAAATIPDADHVKSFVGGKLEFVSIPLSFFFRHRGITHNLVFVLVLCSLAYMAGKEIAAAVLTGYGSHLFLDSLTKKGIRPFYPLKMRVKGFIKTNSFLENALFLAIIAAIIQQLL